MPDTPPELCFPAQRINLQLVRTAMDSVLGVTVLQYAPHPSTVVIPLIAQNLMQGKRNHYGRLALLDDNGALVADGAIPILSSTTKKKIEELAVLLPSTGETAAAASLTTATNSPQDIRAQNMETLRRAAPQLGIPVGAIHDLDSISLRLIVERYYTEFRRPSWAIRPSSSRPLTFVLTYIDCTGAQVSVADRQVELVTNQAGQLLFIRFLIEEALMAPCARSLPELVQRFFPYLQAPITPAAYRRDMPTPVGD